MNWQPLRSLARAAGVPLALGVALASALFAAGGAADATAVGRPARQIITVQIYTDRIDPAQLSLQVSSTVTIEATNSTGVDCTFYIEGLLTALLVPGGGSARDAFEVPAVPPRADTIPGATTGGASDSGSVTVPMGCRGVSAQQGRAVVTQQPGT